MISPRSIFVILLSFRSIKQSVSFTSRAYSVSLKPSLSAAGIPNKFHLYSNSKKQDNEEDDDLIIEADSARRTTIINAIGVGLILSSAVASAQLYTSYAYTPKDFQRISPIQFIAALGDPKANSGSMAKEWGLWRLDPGPRGVFLKDYTKLIKEKGNIAPVGWKFDSNDWWLEEHGIIMEPPSFPIPAGRYLVTGGRSVTTGLTIDSSGNWKLDGDATLFDVTHLPCRSARYQPVNGGSPETAKQSDFPVFPGATMPSVEGCKKQDYAVLFIVGKAI